MGEYALVSFAKRKMTQQNEEVPLEVWVEKVWDKMTTPSDEGRMKVCPARIVYEMGVPVLLRTQVRRTIIERMKKSPQLPEQQ